MKYLRELLIKLSIYLAGEFVSRFFNLPIPGNITGMLILLALLYFKIIDVKKVENISNFFLNHLPFFFIPAGVGLINSMGILKDSWFQILLVSVITTVFIIIITGYTVEKIQNKKNN